MQKVLAKPIKLWYYLFVECTDSEARSRGSGELSEGIRLHGQAVKTPPFHGGNRGSNPLGVTQFNMAT